MPSAPHAPGRLSAAMSAAAAVYSGAVALVCVGVSLLIDRPLRFDPMAVEPLFSAMRFHAVAAAMSGIAWMQLRRRADSPRATRIVLLGLAVGLVVSLDRVIGVCCPPPADNGSLFEPHPTRGWAYRRNTVGHTGGVEVRLNSLGLRGADLPRDKPAGEYRVLLLGDSIAFGYGVAERDSLAMQLEQAWQRVSSGRRIRVVNAGVMGYTTWQECDVLERESPSLLPDAVVLAFCFNDVMDLLGVSADDVSGLLPEFRPSTARFHWSGLVRGVRTALDTNRSVVGRWIGERHFPRETFRETFGPSPSSRAADAWSRTLGDLDRMAALCRSRDVPFLVAVFPYREQLETLDAPRPQTRMEQWAARTGVTVIDLLPAFANAGMPPDRLFFDPLHPTAAGSGIAAASIGEFLNQRRGKR